ncbi:MAG: TIGR02391 family protein [Pseudonocardia sp.]|nr:TIGR02391 family protein [Pseudonocardia sp.]
MDLHSAIAERVRSQFLLGEYELAALAAMRQVEIRVRELSGAGAGDIGVALMRQAFKVDGGLLADPRVERGEREAMSAFFAGAIGVFKNPVSHRQVDYEDPTQASEIVLVADLMLRILDGREERIQNSLSSST